MDCSSGAQLGRQFTKDAVMMHEALHMDPTVTEQDGLMQPVVPIMSGVPDLDWSHTIAMPQHHAAAEAPWQHEMEQGALSQQTQNVQHQLVQQSVRHSAMPALLDGMMAANMTMGIMIPRTAYQPTMALCPSKQPVSTVSAAQDHLWADQLSTQQWGVDYSEVQNFDMEGQEGPATVAERTSRSQFYAFMDRVRKREIVLDEEAGKVVSGPGPDLAVEDDVEHLRKWCAQENLHMPDHVFTGAQGVDGDDAVMNGDLFDGEHDMEDWAKEYNEMQERLQKAINCTDYPFEPNNPYLYHADAFKEGTEMVQLSNLAEAVLAFEAVCQKEPSNATAWRLLGTTQAENEKDKLAIIALNNARQHNPKDLAVHAALSVSHTNEHNTEAAMDSLKAWLLNHPEYEHIAGVHIDPDVHHSHELSDAYFFADPTRFGEVKTWFEAAIEINPNDATLYSSLGVLYNISHEYDLAAKYFRMAVNLHPDDAKLWNKLGATLANGSHPEQALEAYNRALDINPGYVRAMYNMAVAYSNMSKNELAAKQIVRAIAVQQGGTNPSGPGSSMAAMGMWDLLRMTLSVMEREDLAQAAQRQELAPFLSEFQLEGVV